MAGWSGFTDEDLRKMKVNSEKDERVSRNSAQRQAQAQAAARRQRQAQQRGLASSASRRQNSRDSEPTQPLDRSMQLGGATNIANEVSGGPRGPQTQSQKKDQVKQNGDVQNCASDEPKATEETKENQSPEKEVKELDENEALNVELENVQKFQQQQKVIEEANKQKRALLAKAIEDRRKRAKAEADKLLRVQQELNHLDSLLTADVGIIRDKIEVASLEYMDAQKRYERAEKEFIAAKMDLYEKGEAKESLTEHLYTIIHQNEV
ncbi:rAB6-interacting golgin-like [Elysia marginata]|uniref:RAB6-interacting golgin n=1 Tax=Elysia marginata TaxID=1093978 RepID=A0AAV4FDI5_9GAST|nr:rAB6-interacting golgin-like [Elysia marginata]